MAQSNIFISLPISNQAGERGAAWRGAAWRAQRINLKQRDLKTSAALAGLGHGWAGPGNLIHTQVPWRGVAWRGAVAGLPMSLRPASP